MSFGEQIMEQQLEETRELVQNPTWYLELSLRERLRFAGRIAISSVVSVDRDIIRNVRDGMYETFERLLDEGVVALGAEGQSMPDEQRKDIDRIVIHHTKRDGLSKSKLNAMELIRLYVPTYSNLPKDDPEYHLPIYSGHFREGEQVFWPYHWLVNTDGSTERLLNDDEIGWHSGDWDVNTRSIAIAINTNLTNRTPPRLVVEAVNDLINSNYSQVDNKQSAIVGHREVNSKTTCPGNKFLGSNGWKRELTK